MSYQPKDWKNYSNTSTPITAADLNRIDNGVRIAIDSCDFLNGKIEDLREDLEEFEQTGYPVASIQQAVAEWCSENAVGVQSDTITTIWSGTQAQYNALNSYSDSTLYVISG